MELCERLTGAPRRAGGGRDILTVVSTPLVQPALTLLGSVASLIVAEATREARVEIGFLEYSRVGVPLTILTLAVGWLVLILVPV